MVYNSHADKIPQASHLEDTTKSDKEWKHLWMASVEWLYNVQFGDVAKNKGKIRKNK